MCKNINGQKYWEVCGGNCLKCGALKMFRIRALGLLFNIFMGLKEMTVMSYDGTAYDMILCKFWLF